MVIQTGLVAQVRHAFIATAGIAKAGKNNSVMGSRGNEGAFERGRRMAKRANNVGFVPLEASARSTQGIARTRRVQAGNWAETKRLQAAIVVSGAVGKQASESVGVAYGAYGLAEEEIAMHVAGAGAQVGYNSQLDAGAEPSIADAGCCAKRVAVRCLRVQMVGSNKMDMVSAAGTLTYGPLTKADVEGSHTPTAKPGRGMAGRSCQGARR